MKKNLFLLVQYGLPQRLLTALLGKLAHASLGGLTTWVIRQFVRYYGVNLEEAVLTEASDYKTFNAFFTRALNPKYRPILKNADTIISPVDGTISQIGYLSESKLIQAKGRDFDLLSLLGGQNHLEKQFQNGAYATLYLSPKDYHRVHMPVDGQLKEAVYIPGKLFSVSDTSAELIPNLFSRNERLVQLFSTEKGPFAVILVGAMIVSGIKTVWGGYATPPRLKNLLPKIFHDGIRLTQGEEVGWFELGSTVIILFPKNSIEWGAELQSGQSIKMGQNLGQFKSST